MEFGLNCKSCSYAKYDYDFLLQINSKFIMAFLYMGLFLFILHFYKPKNEKRKKA